MRRRSSQDSSHSGWVANAGGVCVDKARRTEAAPTTSTARAVAGSTDGAVARIFVTVTA